MHVKYLPVNQCWIVSFSYAGEAMPLGPANKRFFQGTKELEAALAEIGLRVDWNFRRVVRANSGHPR